jgi:superfamily II DNA or RNA helicase
MKKKMLILAHRDELLEQARDKLLTIAPEVRVTIEQAARHADPAAQVVIASVPTLGRSGSKRLEALKPDDFSIVVVDEAHHAVAKTYRRIFDHFALFAGGEALLVGFTATPRRGDGRGLGEVFEDIVYARGIEEMIREGWLCSVTGWRLTTDVDLDEVEVRSGDFVEAQLARAINLRSRNDAVLDGYSKYASGRRAIVFCADVAHAKAVAETFASAGINAQAVWGEMPRESRRAALESLRAGATMVLTNCNVLTEGFDEPRVDCVIMARPTKSRLLYAQMIGRGTRQHPGKTNLIVIDVADNSREHSLAGIHNVLDLPADINLQGADALRTADAIRKIASACPWIALEELRSGSDVRLLVDAMQGVVRAKAAIAERIRFFSFEPPEAIRGLTNLAWHTAPGGDFALELGDERLLITQTILGKWALMLYGRGATTRLQSSQHLEWVVGFADEWIRRERTESVKLASMEASWRQLPPTEKQLAQISKMRTLVPKTLTRGQASWIISLQRNATRS